LSIWSLLGTAAVAAAAAAPGVVFVVDDMVMDMVMVLNRQSIKHGLDIFCDTITLLSMVRFKSCFCFAFRDSCVCSLFLLILFLFLFHRGAWARHDRCTDIT
jgi:hypothetical protein